MSIRSLCGKPFWTASVIVVGVMVSRGAAEIVSLDARVSTTVQELIDSEPASFSEDSESRDVDGGNIPMSALSDIVSTDLSGQPVARGFGLGGFADPTRLDQPNPEELTVEAACYSNDESVSYRVTAAVEEARTLRFSRSEVSFEATGAREFESSVFLSGAIVVWATRGDADLAGLECEVHFEVARDGIQNPLFQTGVNLRGVGRVVETTTSGSIQFDEIEVAELAERGVDQISVDALREVSEQGILMIFAVPEQRFSYRYSAMADEAIGVIARLEARIRGTPDGVGAAVVMGRPFAELAEFIEAGIPGAKGEPVERAINEAIASRAMVSQPDLESPAFVRRRLPCGVVGGEALLVLFMPLSVVSRCRSPKGWTPPPIVRFRRRVKS